MLGRGSFDTRELAARPFEPFPDAVLQSSVAERFEAVARRHAARPAVSDLRDAWTYAELAARADRIAAATARAAAKPGPVAILLRNEAAFSAAIFGVLAAGRAFIPLDAEHPAERNRLIAAHAGLAAAVTAGDLRERAAAVFAPGLPVIDIDALPKHGSAPAARPGAEDIGAIMYTSGSTGIPKGVCQDHRGLLFGAQQWTNVMHVGCEDRMSLVTSPSSYAGIRNIFTALLSGASLHVMPPKLLQPAGLVREIRRRRITIYRSVPTVFRHLAAAIPDGERLDILRIVYLGGDRAEWSDFDAFRRVCRDDAVMAVGLSSTESVASYGWWFIDGNVRDRAPRLPAGRTMGDPAIALLDDAGRPVDDNETGEIVLTSRYLATGYWREPELTAQAFGTDADDPGRRTYRTGDMARRRPDGLFEFLGRRDQQLKLHGQRIEIAEIESALLACTGVQDAAVAVRRDSDGEPYALAAYVELRPGVKGLLPRHLMTMLSQRLPTAMMPAAIVILSELPRLPNQKVDRKRLADIDAQRAAASSEAVEDPMIRAVATVFEKVLGYSASAEDNVLTLGGDSVQAIAIALELEDRFDIEIPIDEFQATQSIRELADWIAVRRREETASAARA